MLKCSPCTKYARFLFFSQNLLNFFLHANNTHAVTVQWATAKHFNNLALGRHWRNKWCTLHKPSSGRNVSVLNDRARHATTLPRQCDHVSGQYFCIIALCLYLLCLFHLDTEAVTFFLASEALLYIVACPALLNDTCYNFSYDTAVHA